MNHSAVIQGQCPREGAPGSSIGGDYLRGSAEEHVLGRGARPKRTNIAAAAQTVAVGRPRPGERRRGYRCARGSGVGDCEVATNGGAAGESSVRESRLEVRR